MGTRVIVLVVVAVLASVDGQGITVPGTKWCGPGNNAQNYNDLGSEVELDMCCRAHDNCEEKISPFSELHGLTNDEIFPIFSCGCEAAFRQCLSSLHNMESAVLGRIYFSSRNSCFNYGPPIKSCQERQFDLFKQRCLSYNVDASSPGRWQFYDLAFYTHPNEEAYEWHQPRFN